MLVSRLLLTLLGLCYTFLAFATAKLTVDGDFDYMEEGRTYTFRFEYIQTEGIDDYGNLAYNPTFFSNVTLAEGQSFQCKFRDESATVNVHRKSDGNIVITTNNGKEVSRPFSDGKHKFAVGMRDADMMIWIDADTTSAPAYTFPGFKQKEGKVSYTSTVASVLSDTKVHYDYAYGLRFVFHIPEGAEINDIDKTHDQRVIYNYQHTSQPPMLFRSAPSSDMKYIYCDLQPTPLDKPIPYGTIYTFEWKEKVKKCIDVNLTNRVTVELYKHDEVPVFFEKTCPCGDNTCELDTTFITVDSYCLNGDKAVLTANTSIDGKDCYCEWKMNSMKYKSVDGNVLTIDREGTYQVTVTDKNDETCVVTSPLFELKRSRTPEVSLPDTVSTELPLKLTPTIKGNGNYSYEWSTGENTQSITVDEPGRYTLTVYNGECKVDVSTLVKLSINETFPTVVTPNGDGVNDVFDVSAMLGQYPDATVTIYDRTGKVLSEYMASDKGWDGTYNGNDLPSTDYWYKVDIPYLDKTFTGHFTLLRGRN